MTHMLRPIQAFTVIFPGIALCYLPVLHALRGSLRRLLALYLPLLSVYCVGAGLLCYQLNWPADRLLYPALLLFAIDYLRRTTLPRWKTISILLGVAAMFSCLSTLSVAFDSLFRENNILPWLTIPGGLIANLLGWVFVALVAWPAFRRVPWLLEADRLSSVRYLFWVVPSLFTILNLVLVPIDYNNVRVGRMFQGYILVECLFLAMLLLFYLLCFRIARELDAKSRLQQENQFLQMQSAQYEVLRTSIAETRQARHDLRHHLNAISALAQREDWPALNGYLAQVRESVPSQELQLCLNPAVDGVAGHYATLCRREQVAFTCKLDLPRQLPVSEMDLCVVLSNLLENALEASAPLPEDRRHIRVQARLHKERLVLLMVENTYQGILTRQEDGLFLSSKRKGSGVGLQSVQRIAEKNGGYCNFDIENGIFRAKIMLRGTSPKRNEESR